MFPAHYFLCIADYAVALSALVFVGLDCSFQHRVSLPIKTRLDNAEHILYAVGFHYPVQQIQAHIMFLHLSLASRSSLLSLLISLFS